MASSVSLVTAPFELPLFVHRPSASVVEPDSAAIPIDSITFDVQPWPSSVPLSTPQVRIGMRPLPFWTLVIDSGLPVERDVYVNPTS